jgi:predicted Holliday junction resolvase-like endonuclease
MEKTWVDLFVVFLSNSLPFGVIIFILTRIHHDIKILKHHTEIHTRAIQIILRTNAQQDVERRPQVAEEEWDDPEEEQRGPNEPELADMRDSIAEGALRRIRVRDHG